MDRLLLFLPLFLAGCVRASPPRDDAGSVDTGLESLVVECSEIAARVRQLSSSAPVELILRDREETSRMISRAVNSPLQAGRLEDELVRLQAFGLVPTPFDLQGHLTRLYRSQLAGFYDTREGRLVMTRESTIETHVADQQRADSFSGAPVAGPEGAVVDAEARSDSPDRADSSSTTPFKAFIVHELVHALQDQNLVPIHGFLASSGESATNQDMRQARRALLEGDASFVMTQYLVGEAHDLSTDLEIGPRALAAIETGLFPGTETLASGPRAFRDQLLFAYLFGMDFVARLLREKGWDLVNAAYQWPPCSTEQVFHPEKYLSGERPHTVELPRFPELQRLGWKEVLEGSWGELGIRSLLARGRGWELVGEAAAGWGGDRYGIYRDADEGVRVLWVTSWDTTNDARQFQIELDRLAADHPSGAPPFASQQREGMVLVWTDAPPLTRVFMDTAWRAITVTRPKPVPPEGVLRLLK